MNQQQLKYTVERLAAVEKRKLEALKKACTVPAKSASDEEIVDLIRRGEVHLKRGRIQRDRHSYGLLLVGDVFDLSKYVMHEHVTDEYAPAAAAISAEATRVRDEIMLGDNTTALHLLRTFEAQ